MANSRMRRALRLAVLLQACLLVACGADGLEGLADAGADAATAPRGDACPIEAAPRCERGVAQQCERDLAGRARIRERDCEAEGLRCAPGLGCAACLPGARECLGPDVIVCEG